MQSITADGGTAVAVQADVSPAAAVTDMSEAAARLGRLGAVVNNAGITGNLIGNLADVPARRSGAGGGCGFPSAATTGV